MEILVAVILLILNSFVFRALEHIVAEHRVASMQNLTEMCLSVNKIFMKRAVCFKLPKSDIRQKIIVRNMMNIFFALLSFFTTMIAVHILVDIYYHVFLKVFCFCEHFERILPILLVCYDFTFVIFK